jgi:DNA-binding response OmpR family regulator
MANYIHIRWLREKLEDSPDDPPRILTVRGVGYKPIPKESQTCEVYDYGC